MATHLSGQDRVHGFPTRATRQPLSPWHGFSTRARDLRSSRRCSLLPPLLLISILFGCGKRADLPTWQRTVERHVIDTGGGDPSVLRNVTLADGRPGFAIFSRDRPSESTDAVGVLLGHREVNRRLWVVYLFGLVDRQHIKEIRLAAMEVMEDGGYRWIVGKPDRQALETYRNYNATMARERFPDRREPPAEYLGFPLPGDRFDLTNEDSILRAIHPPSGATWTITLPGS